MKISIVIPVYNVSAYIGRCLASVKSQTYGDCEVILVDDCGTDDSIAQCESYINQNRLDWRIVHHTRNRGLSAARNTGTAVATGDYVLYVDSDDELLPNCVQAMVDVAKAYPLSQIVQGLTLSVPEKAYYDMTRYSGIDFVADRNWIVADFLCPSQSLPVNAWNKLIRLDYIRENNLIFEEGLIHEDEMWMLHSIKSLSAIAFVHEYTYKHYSTVGSIMSTMKWSGHLSSWTTILLAAAHPWDSRYDMMQLRKYIVHYTYRLESFSEDDVRCISRAFSSFAWNCNCRELAFILWLLSVCGRQKLYGFTHDYLVSYCGNSLGRHFFARRVVNWIQRFPGKILSMR